jgi:hypothetical protein
MVQTPGAQALADAAAADGSFVHTSNIGKYTIGQQVANLGTKGMCGFVANMMPDVEGETSGPGVLHIESERPMFDPNTGAPLVQTPGVQAPINWPSPGTFAVTDHTVSIPIDQMPLVPQMPKSSAASPFAKPTLVDQPTVPWTGKQRRALEKFYKQQDPSKLSNIDKIIGKWAPKALENSLAEKYGTAPNLTGGSASPKSPKSAEEEVLQESISVESDRVYGMLQLKMKSMFGDKWPKIQCGYDPSTSIFSYEHGGRRETVVIATAERVPDRPKKRQNRFDLVSCAGHSLALAAASPREVGKWVETVGENTDQRTRISVSHKRTGTLESSLMVENLQSHSADAQQLRSNGNNGKNNGHLPRTASVPSMKAMGLNAGKARSGWSDGAVVVSGGGDGATSGDDSGLVEVRSLRSYTVDSIVYIQSHPCTRTTHSPPHPPPHTHALTHSTHSLTHSHTRILSGNHNQNQKIYDPVIHPFESTRLCF